MPIYCFVCSECGSKKEEIQSFKDEAPLCCGEPTERSFNYKTTLPRRSFIKRLLEGDRNAIEQERHYRDKRAAVDYKTINQEGQLR